MARLLPEDLTVVLLSDWLQVGLITLSHLDVAWCHRASRSNWLSVLSKIRIADENIRNPVCNFASWLQERHVNVIHFVTQLAYLHDMEAIPHFSLRTVSLALKGHSTPARYQQYLSWFPQLTALDCIQSVLSDRYLVEMCRLRCPLRKLALEFERVCSPAAIAGVIIATCSNLEDLSCHTVDYGLLSRLNESCRKLKAIDWMEADMEPAQLISYLSDNPQLTHVSIGGRAVTDDVIAHVLISCPEITVINHNDTSPLVNMSFAFLKPLTNLNCAIKLKNIQIFPFYLEFSPCSTNSERRICDVTLFAVLPDESAMFSMLSHLTAPLRSVTAWKGKYGALCGAKSLLLLAKSHGCSLEKLSIQLGEDVTRMEVQQFLAHCPNLIILSLTSMHINLMTDDHFRNVTLQCPRLVLLVVFGPNDSSRKWQPPGNTSGNFAFSTPS